MHPTQALMRPGSLVLAGAVLATGCGTAGQTTTGQSIRTATGQSACTATGEAAQTFAASSAQPQQRMVDGKPVLSLPASQAPCLRLRVHPDKVSGWNLHLTVERFAFTPELSGQDARSGGGHAHLHLDGEKLARIYGPWHHLAADLVPKGRHTLSVQLNANDHTPWASDGTIVEATTSIEGGKKDDEHTHEH